MRSRHQRRLGQVKTPAVDAAAPARKTPPSIFRLLDIPTRANQPFQCVGEGSAYAADQLFATWIPRRGSFTWQMRVDPFRCPTRWASSAIFPRAGRCSSGHVAGGGRRRFAVSRGGCPIRISGADGSRWKRCWRNRRPDIPRYWSSTNSMRCLPSDVRLCWMDRFEGAARCPFVCQCSIWRRLDELRQQLAAGGGCAGFRI